MRTIALLILSSVPVLAQSGNTLPSPGSAAPKYLTLVTSASLSTAKPGAKVSLLVDIVPNPGIHVYAPGAKGYLPIAMTLASTKEATAARTTYPKAEMLSFAELNETVPIYRKPFRLRRDLTIARSARPSRLTVTGTIDYQACDDKVCFAPESVPVAWTISLIP